MNDHTKVSGGKLSVFLTIILGANVLYAIGSLLNGYSLFETLPGLVAKIAIEVVCLIYAARGKSVALYILLAIWTLTCGVSLWYSLHVEAWIDRLGLLLNVVLYVYVFLGIGVFRISRRQQALSKEAP